STLWTLPRMTVASPRRAASRLRRQRLGRPDLERIVGEEVERAGLRGHDSGGGGGGDRGRSAQELGRELAACERDAGAVRAEVLIDVGDAARGIGDIRRKLL